MKTVETHSNRMEKIHDAQDEKRDNFGVAKHKRLIESMWASLLRPVILPKVWGAGVRSSRGRLPCRYRDGEEATK
jgi:hypothetical protein